MVSDNLVGLKLSKSVFGPKDGSGKRDEVVHAGKKINAALLQQLHKMEVEEVEVTEADLEGAFWNLAEVPASEESTRSRGSRAA